MKKYIVTTINESGCKFDFEISESTSNNGATISLFAKHKAVIEVFELRIQKDQERKNHYRISAIYANDSFYRSKFLPETIFDKMLVQRDIIITSSSNKILHQQLISERRSEEATKMWLRLQNKKLATYDSECDLFIYTGDRKII